jgi:hypothetical protein
MEFDWMKHPDNPNLLVIMRGVSGSGKSYRARELAGDDQEAIISADQFFGESCEEYRANWSVDGLHAAHKDCSARVRGRMQRQLPLVIVDNTNTRMAEMMPYFSMAVQYDYRVEVHEPTSDIWLNDIVPYLGNNKQKKENAAKLEEACQRLFEINQKTHGVPLASIQKQLRRYAVGVDFDSFAKSYVRHGE